MTACERHNSFNELDSSEHLSEEAMSLAFAMAKCPDCNLLLEKSHSVSTSFLERGGSTPPGERAYVVAAHLRGNLAKPSLGAALARGLSLLLCQFTFIPALAASIVICKIIRGDGLTVYWSEIMTWIFSFYSPTKTCINYRASFAGFDSVKSNAHLSFPLSSQKKRIVLIVDGILRKTFVRYAFLRRHVFEKCHYSEDDTEFVIPRLPMMGTLKEQAEALAYVIERYYRANQRRFDEGEIEVVLVAHSLGWFVSLEYLRLAPPGHRVAISALHGYGPPLAGNPLAMVLPGLPPSRQLFSFPGIVRNEYLIRELNVRRLREEGEISRHTRIVICLAQGDLTLDLAHKELVLDELSTYSGVEFEHVPSGGHFFGITFKDLRTVKLSLCLEGMDFKKAFESLLPAGDRSCPSASN